MMNFSDLCIGLKCDLALLPAYRNGNKTTLKKEVAGAIRLLKNEKVYIFSAFLQFGGNVYCGVLVLTFRRKEMLPLLKSSDFFQNVGTPSHQLIRCRKKRRQHGCEILISPKFAHFVCFFWTAGVLGQTI
jgi:hypothetical protein